MSLKAGQKRHRAAIQLFDRKGLPNYRFRKSQVMTDYGGLLEKKPSEPSLANYANDMFRASFGAAKAASSLATVLETALLTLALTRLNVFVTLIVVAFYRAYTSDLVCWNS